MAQPAYKKAWADRNREYVRAKSIAYNKANPEKMRAASAKYAKAHPEKVRARKNAWNRANPEKARARTLAWKAANRERALEAGARWRANNFAKRRQYQIERQAYSARAIPRWANQFFIDEIYDLARLRSKVTGQQWHVDHIVPLRSPKVCGLHVHDNLRVIPAVVNRVKGNRVWPDMA